MAEERIKQEMEETKIRVSIIKNKRKHPNNIYVKALEERYKEAVKVIKEAQENVEMIEHLTEDEKHLHEDLDSILSCFLMEEEEK